MKNKKNFNLIFWGFTLLPLAVTGFVFRFLPEQVPAHFNIEGEIDRWGSRNEAFIFPVAIILLSFLWEAFMRFTEKKSVNATADKEKKEAENNLKYLRLILLSVVIFFNVMCYTILYNMWKLADKANVSGKLGLSCIVIGAMGAMFIVIGNFMPKCKRNGMIGLRTIWSMDNDEAWALSQRYGGKLFLVSGLITIIFSFTGNAVLAGTILITTLLCDIVLAIYLSSVAYKKSKLKK